MAGLQILISFRAPYASVLRSRKRRTNVVIFSALHGRKVTGPVSRERAAGMASGDREEWSSR